MVTPLGQKQGNSTSSPPFGHRTCMLVGSPLVADMVDAIDCGHTFIVEQNALTPGIAPLGHFHLRLTSKTAYSVALIEVLDHFLLHKTKLHPIICEKILTTSHECLMNALLWNNLEIPSSKKAETGLHFDNIIKSQLNNPEIASRPLDLIIIVEDAQIQITIKSSHGYFDLGKSLSQIKSPCQGLAVVNSFADEFIAEEDGRTIHLRFFI